MSTRGTIGFRVSENDKVTYNHSDSYPTWLGIQVMSFILNTPESELKDIANRIELVDEDSKPSSELIEAYRGYADTDVATQTLTDWYCLLRHTQGELEHYRNGVRHMIDYSTFLHDSLFCEWAYIINLDTQELEIYKGFNKNKKGKGRYASKFIAPDRIGEKVEYYGVTLLTTMKLSDIRNMSEESIKVFCQALEESVYNRNN